VTAVVFFAEHSGNLSMWQTKVY